MLARILVVLSILVGLLSCVKRERDTSEFHFRIIEDLGTIDWNHGEVIPIVVQQIMEGLTLSGRWGEAKAGVAKGWRFDPKTNTYTFYLREKVKWSDGVEVCAQHFRDGWLRTLSKEVASPYAHYMFGIKNAKAFFEGKKTASEVSINAVNCKVLKVGLENPVAYFPELVSHWIFYPARNDLIEKFPQTWTEPKNLVVNGPYKISEWKRDSHIQFDFNPLYYGKAPHLKKLKALVVQEDVTALNLFKTGVLDETKEVPLLYRDWAVKQPEYKSSDTFVVYFLGFNFKSDSKYAALSRDQRCALAHSLEKSEIPRVLKGEETPAYSLVPSAMLDQRFSIERTRLKKVDLSKLNGLKVNYYSKSIHASLMEWVHSQWKKNLSLNVQLIRTDQKTYWSRLLSNPGLVYLTGITANYAHPYTFLSQLHMNSPGNFGHFESEKYETLIREISKTSVKNQKRLIDLTEKAMRVLLDEECAIVPLYFRKTATLLQKGWLGFSINPLTVVYLKDVYRLD
ncbi:MAG: peptide ABC transporter substrate-binding protein [Bacteriovoracia bacterium]